MSEPPASSEQAGEQTVSCRRCDKPYRLPDPAPRFMGCPHCGASPTALLHSNQASALVAFLSLVVLVPAMFLPFIRTVSLGQEESFSLLGGIVVMVKEGGAHTFLGLLLFFFSVIFPITKLLALLASTSAILNLSAGARRKIHHIVEVTGKLSLLDVVVVALLIVIIKVKDVASVHASVGTVLFCVAILLSLLAGFLVSFEHLEDETPANP